jgi:hypothetical protein
MGGSTTTTQQGSSQSTNQVPQWVQNAGQQNYGLAQQVASQPLQQYQGQMVADTAPQTQQAWNLAANSGQVGQDAQNASQAGYLNTMGQTPAQVNPAQISQQNLSPYMNPFTNSVINASLPIMQQNLANSQNQQQNAANSANAYGGSRQAIQQGVTQAQGALGMGQMAAGLNQANFQQAQQAAGTDVASQNQAKLANQAAGLTQEQLVNQAASGLGTLGGQQMQNNIANYGMLTSAGGFEQQQAQNDINAQLAKFQQAFQYPQQQLSLMESALGMTPYDTATSGTSASTSTQTQSNPMAMALGGLQTLGGLFSAPAGGMSAASGLMSLSDRRLKTDIVKIGKHPTGIDMYAYRYKGDPKHYPKVVGPMAEDVKKIAPHAVRRVTTKGHMAVHMDMLNALAPSSPGVAKAIGIMRQGPQPGGGLSPAATPPSRGIQHFADGTAYVLPDMQQIRPDYFQRGKAPDDLTGVADPTPSGAAGLKALLDRGYAYPSKARGYADGTAMVLPSLNPNDTAMGTSNPEMESNMRWHAAAQQWQDYVHNRGKEGPTKMYAHGVSRVPGHGWSDKVPAMLTPGEAVLNRHAAEHLGRGNIARLNAHGVLARGKLRAPGAPILGALGG